MKILTPHGYPMTFNLPDEVREHAIRDRFPDLGQYWKPGEALALYRPFHSCQIVHLMNKIPLVSRTPWVVTFESAIPRVHGRAKMLRNILRKRLLSPQCLGIIAMSQWARNIVVHENPDWKELPKVLEKMTLIYPTTAVRRPTPRTLGKDETLEIVFVGNNFARKGGIVALRMAKKAAALGLKVKFHLVSAMLYANGNHTDHPDPQHYAEDLKNMDLPNVQFHGTLKNNEVQQLMERGHIHLLSTLHDTFGFSILEGFAWGLPALATNVCAIPEMVVNNENGFLIDLPRDGANRWRGLAQTEASDYWSVVNAAYDSMAEQGLEAITALVDHPESMERLSLGAINTLRTKFNPHEAAAALEKIYSKAFPVKFSTELSSTLDKSA